MSRGPEYIKDVEEYFISLAGEGIMLSSIDYDLIRGWRERDFPVDVVLMGIKRAFSDRGHRNGPGGGTIRGLRHCADYIESCADEYGVGTERRAAGGKNEAARVRDAESVPEKLGRLIESERNAVARKYYIDLRMSMLRQSASGAEGGGISAAEAEEQAMERLFGSLPEKEREKILRAAGDLIGDRARRMTEKAYRESLISFRNEIVSKKYSIKSVI